MLIKACFTSATLLGFLVAIAISSTTTLAYVVVGYDCSGSPTICAGSCYYTRPQGEGAYILNTGLNYDKDSRASGRARQRRNAIGCGSGNYCRQFGLSCDEFPMASTYQGGLGVASNGYQARSIGETTCVPAAEQNYQGGTLSGIYKDKPDGWNFTPVVRNYQNIEQCEQANPTSPPAHYHVRTQQRNGRRSESRVSTWPQEQETAIKEVTDPGVRISYRLSNNHTVTPVINGVTFALGQEFSYIDSNEPDHTDHVKVVEIIGAA